MDIGREGGSRKGGKRGRREEERERGSEAGREGRMDDGRCNTGLKYWIKNRSFRLPSYKLRKSNSRFKYLTPNFIAIS